MLQTDVFKWPIVTYQNNSNFRRVQPGDTAYVVSNKCGQLPLLCLSLLVFPVALHLNSDKKQRKRCLITSFCLSIALIYYHDCHSSFTFTCLTEAASNRNLELSTKCLMTLVNLLRLFLSPRGLCVVDLFFLRGQIAHVNEARLKTGEGVIAPRFTSSY